jgi:cysteine-rich repeat protein
MWRDVAVAALVTGGVWLVATCSDPSVGSCGNGVVEGDEECDNGNPLTAAAGMCTNACRFERGGCGNGVPEAGEQCDDGNLVSGDGCDDSCYWEDLCGNNVLDDGEECDDGNELDNDDCVLVDRQCKTARCGDGHVRTNPARPSNREECDYEDPDDPEECTTHCTRPAVADGDADVDVDADADAEVDAAAEVDADGEVDADAQVAPDAEVDGGADAALDADA